MRAQHRWVGKTRAKKSPLAPERSRAEHPKETSLEKLVTKNCSCEEKGWWSSGWGAPEGSPVADQRL
jgi:hypothetical protein